MERLEFDQLVELEDAIIDNLWDALTKANADGSLKQLLSSIGLSHLVQEVLGIEPPLKTWREGKILVVGDAQCRPKDLIGVAKDLGIGQTRIEYVDIDKITNYDFTKLEYSPNWCAVLFGATPHSTKGKGRDSSTLSHMEKHRDRYPEVRRLQANSRLKITKTNFRETLQSLIAEGFVVAG